MDNEQSETPRNIVINYNKEFDVLVISLDNEGIEYVQKALTDLKTRQVDAHFHIDDFDGWLGGDFKHLVIMKGGFAD